MTKGRKKIEKRAGFFDDLAPHTKQAIGAIVFAVLAIFFLLSSLHFAGRAGELTYASLSYLFGYGFVLAPVVCALYVYVLLKPREDEQVSISKVIGVALFFLSALGLLGLFFEVGGLVGRLVTGPLLWLFGEAVAGVVLGAVILIGLFLTFNTGFLAWFKKKEETTELTPVDLANLNLPPELQDGKLKPEGTESEPAPETNESESKKSMRERIGLGKNSDFTVSSFVGTYAPPPLTLLHRDKGKARVGDVKASANTIKQTLKNFGIEVEMDEVAIGPTVTRYALKPAQGVKIARIVGLQRELELNLASGTIRIEAPIPGKSLVGIEVPNAAKATIGLASLLTSPEYTDSPKPLLVALGKDITGQAHFGNIARMPHGLIAGTTGSGKSVMIQNLIVSLLFRNSPEQLRFIMVDPKRVELTLYNEIPHLLTPVITDAKKAIIALRWAIKEMERRYNILQSEKVRDIGAYHDSVYQPAKDTFVKNGSIEEEKSSLPEPMPYIVIIVDELSDLMQAYPRELEASIVRLAQMSRAVGIHIMLATQRPEVKVITGLIKANVPCRIAFKVNSQIDSRTILDAIGAEKLLGYGDMLYQSPDQPKPVRLQSAFVTTEEIRNIVSYLKDQTEAHELDTIDLSTDNKGMSGDAAFASSLDDDDEDELYEDARAAVLEAGKASTSYLQRKLRVGYSRAARLIDILEERGVIGPGEGSKPREVLERRGESNEEEPT